MSLDLVPMSRRLPKFAEDFIGIIGVITRSSPLRVSYLKVIPVNPEFGRNCKELNLTSFC